MTTTWLVMLMLLLVCSWVHADPCHPKSGSSIKTSLVWKRLCEQTIRRTDAAALTMNKTSYEEPETKTKNTVVMTTTVRPKMVVTTMVRPKGVQRLMTTTTIRPKVGVKEKKEGVKNRVPTYSSKLPKDKKAPLVNIKLLKDNTAASTEVEGSSGRQHKAFFANYPMPQRFYQDKGAKQITKKKPKPGKKRPRPESDIYYIKLPPAPYSYVPGLGYISQPPTFSTSHLAAPRPQRPENPFIKLPIDFVSNGKPTAVYRWPAKDEDKKESPVHHHKYKPDSPIIRLNRGPYYFNGKPINMYVMKKDPPRPTNPNLY